MNNPSPLIPQGSLLEQKNKSRARVKVAFFCVVGVHVAAILVALLAQGCKREQMPAPETEQPPVPNVDTNLPALDTNTPIPGPETSSAVPVPTPQIEPVAPAVPAAQEYVIQRGDTFSSIAPKFHVTVKALQAANPNVDPARLQIDQKIMIPPPAAAPAPTPELVPAPDSGGQIYTVKSGDSLTKIAAEFHTTVNALRKANPKYATTDRIKVGDKLTIPVSAAPPPTVPSPGAPPQ